jgi:hypothetical protein
VILNPHFMLTFGTTRGGTRVLRIPHARMDASPETVRNAMNMMVNSEIFAEDRGRLFTSRAAAYVQVNRSEIPVR